MSKIKTIFSFLMVLFLWCVWAPSSQAQAARVLTVNHVVTEENTESLALDAFFTIMDENGRPVSNPNIESATIQLIGSNAAPISASVDDPQTPIYITLLIDGSGSMKDVIDDVRNAAIAAIDSAPATAQFAVVQFNENAITLQDFTSDHDSVKNAIRYAESEPNKGTCLYDAVYDAIGTLDDRIQNPQDRRAIILFTDGKDQLTATSDAPCSIHSYDNVISAANPSNTSLPTTPIHTIGLFDGQGENINASELRNMAADTAAFSAIGNQTNLSGLFQEIMDGLNSQLVAHADVFATQGENQAVLSVKVRDVEVPLTATFNFISDINHDAPLPPAGIQINSLIYEEDDNMYVLSLGIANAESIHQLIVNVWDVRRGTQESTDQTFENLDQTLVVELDASDLEAGREYSIHIQAKSEDGSLIADEKGNTVLAKAKIIHDPAQASPVEFTIEAITPDYDNGLLIVSINIASDADRVQTYEGIIVDADTGQKVAGFEPTPFTSVEIQEVLPETIQSIAEPRSYRVTLYLMTQEQVRSEGVMYEFTTPDRSRGLFARAASGLVDNPALSLSILIIILAIIGFFVIKRRRKKQEAPQPVRPPVDKTSLYGFRVYPEPSDKEGDVEAWSIQDEDIFSRSAPGGGTVAPRLRLTVVHSPGRARGLKKTITTFPCSIGREGCDVNIVGDGRVSRVHAEISLRNNKLFVTDLKSRNGTFLGSKRLSPHTSEELSDSQILRLGTKTTIELNVI